MQRDNDFFIGRLADQSEWPPGGFELVYLSGGVVCFGWPGQARDWGPVKREDGYVVNFSEGLFRSFLLDPGYIERWSFWGQAGKERVRTLQGEVRQKAETVLGEMAAAYKKDDPVAYDLVRVLLLQLLLIIGENGSETGEKRAVMVKGRIC
jgi:hypothetical protein